ncbi:MAG: cupin domain-containing protein [Cytophagales bacterium]|nr:cupin domain-containing protein [Cytophagales bacterium]
MTSLMTELQNVQPREVFPGFQGRFVHSDNMTFAYWEIRKGATVPLHSHVHEQVANMLEGEFELEIDGQKHRLSPGSVAVIPSNAMHTGIALSDCRILDVFSPVREDYK